MPFRSRFRVWLGSAAVILVLATAAILAFARPGCVANWYARWRLRARLTDAPTNYLRDERLTEALKKYEPGDVAAVLTAFLASPDPRLRSFAACHAGEHGLPWDWPKLHGMVAKLLDDDDPEVRQDAATAFGTMAELGPSSWQRFEPHLQALMREDPAPMVRGAAAWSLALTGHLAGLQGLIDLIQTAEAPRHVFWGIAGLERLIDNRALGTLDYGELDHVVHPTHHLTQASNPRLLENRDALAQVWQRWWETHGKALRFDPERGVFILPLEE